MMPWETMLPALVVLAVGLVAGTWVALTLRRRAPVEPMRDALDDADERVARSMNHLRELALQEGRSDKATFERERAEIEAQAARALRERDELLAERSVAPPPAVAVPAGASPVVGFLHERPALRGALWATGVFFVVGALFYFVTRDGAPTDAPSMAQQGQDPAMGRVAMPPFLIAEPPPAPGEVEGLVARLRENPHDIDATVRLGHVLIAARMFEEAKVITDRALQLDPTQPEALAHAAALRSVQDEPGGLAAIEAVLAKWPALAEGWLFRGMMAMRAGNTALMQDSFEKYLAHAPAGPEREHVRSMLNGTATGSANP